MRRRLLQRAAFPFAPRASVSQAWQDQAGAIPARAGDPVRRWDDAISYGAHLVNGWAVNP